MLFQIRHSISGRIRLRIPALKNNPSLGELLTGWLKAQPGVLGVRLTPGCFSVVIDYSKQADAPRLSWLRMLERITPQHLRVQATPQLETGSSAKNPSLEWLRSGPLAFATGALALCFLPSAKVLTIPVLLWTAIPSWRRALTVLIHERRLNVDFLDGLAVVIAVFRAQVFTAAFMVWLISLGDWIRDRTAAKSKKTLTELLAFKGQTAWVIRRGTVVRIPAAAVKPGNVVIVYPGELIPVDGVITQGSATVDQRMITGESMPLLRSVGDSVYAGTVLREGKLRLEARRVGSQTTAAQIVNMVESVPKAETRVQNYAEKFADHLVAPWLVAALGTFAITQDAERFLSMVIIDYGTGIRVAAPTSILSYMVAAARQGILIKGGAQMEKLAHSDTIVFDKTGTLTIGMPQVLDVISYDPRRFPAPKILQIAAAVEARLKHPMAEAIVAKARDENLAKLTRSNSRYELGRGIEAQVNGYHIHLGSSRFLRDNGINLGRARNDLRRLEELGCSNLLFAVDGNLLGLLPCVDKLRPESRNVIRALHNRGIKHTILLTGDNSATASSVARQLGMDQFFSNALPSEKAEIVRKLQAEGRTVAMVGDGINDSPALAYADVGIAMKNGADVARESADIVLMQDDLWKVVAAIEISHNAMHLIRQNFAIIAGLNTLALGLAIPARMVSPTVTAMISNGSAILATMNAMRPLMRY
jgi:heavy metal translocating P-type ATPase